MENKISIVTVTYNCKDVVESTILSVAAQLYECKEYIIIDGGSTDGTLDVVKKHKDKITLYVSEPDKGIFDAMNKSLNFISGDYVIFMNAGDRFVNNHVLSDIFSCYNGNYDLIYGDVYVENELGLLFKKADPIYNYNFSSRDLVFRSQGFSHQSLFTKTSVLKEVKFDLRFPLGADYYTTYLIYMNGNHGLYYVGFPISVFDDKTSGASHARKHIPEIMSERLIMFDYNLTKGDKLCLLVRNCIQDVKWYLTKEFPFISTFYRKNFRGYSDKI